METLQCPRQYTCTFRANISSSESQFHCKPVDEAKVTGYLGRVGLGKTRQDKIYFESARHITINISSKELLNRLFENKCIRLTYVQQLQKM